MRALICLATLLAFTCSLALSQGAFHTTTTPGTIAVTNTFQSVLPANDVRHGCLLQNLGTHLMYVFFGPIANATTSNSFQIQPGQTASCQSGVIVLVDQASVTGTSGDAYVVTSQ